MNEAPAITKRTKGRFTVRLDTTLLAMTLIAVVVAYFVAEANVGKWQSRLARLETAIQLPRVRNYRNIEVSPMRGDWAWSIWVPSGRKVKLCLAAEDLDSSQPKKVFDGELKAGRNIIKLALNGSKSHATVLLNDNEIFEREFTRLWNLNGLVSHKNQSVLVSPASDFQAITKATDVIKSMSTVRLEVGEAFDPAKHRTGLRIWIEP